MFVQVEQPGRPRILIGNIYNQRPLAGGDVEDNERRTLTVERLRRIRLPRDTAVILVGDRNLHHSWWEVMQSEPSAPAAATVEWLREHGFTLVNEPDEPTFYAHGSGKPSVLDLVFANDRATRDDLVKDFHVDAAATLDSDHCGLRWTFDPARETVDNPTGARYNWKKADEERFKSAFLRGLEARKAELDVLVEDAVLDAAVLERAATAVNAIFEAAAKEAAPERRASTQAKPFWDADLDRAKAAVRDAAKAQARARDPDAGICQRLANACSHAAAVFKRTMRKKRRKYYGEKLEKSTTKEMWEFPKWTKGRREYPTPPLSRGVDQQPATTHAEKCTLLRDTLLAPPPDLVHAYPELDTPHADAEPYVGVTRLEVERALFAPEPDSAPGPSGISNRALRWAWQAAGITRCSGESPSLPRCASSARRITRSRVHTVS